MSILCRVPFWFGKKSYFWLMIWQNRTFVSTVTRKNYDGQASLELNKKYTGILFNSANPESGKITTAQFSKTMLNYISIPAISSSCCRHQIQSEWNLVLPEWRSYSSLDNRNKNMKTVVYVFSINCITPRYLR